MRQSVSGSHPLLGESERYFCISCGSHTHSNSQEMHSLMSTIDDACTHTRTACGMVDGLANALNVYLEAKKFTAAGSDRLLPALHVLHASLLKHMRVLHTDTTIAVRLSKAPSLGTRLVPPGRWKELVLLGLCLYLHIMLFFFTIVWILKWFEHQEVFAPGALPAMVLLLSCSFSGLLLGVSNGKLRCTE